MESTSFKPNFKLKNGIHAIAGICKNCGKTSLLNCLLAQITDKKTGVLTTGRDGEEKDVVFGNPKPAIILPQDTLFTSTSEIIERLGSAVEVLNKLPFQAANKQLWLMRAIRNIETEITGPASVSDQIATAIIMQKQGAELVFIDGSLDRKSIALHPKVKGVFLVIGSSYGNLEKIMEELSRLVHLSYVSPFMDKNLKALQDNVAVFRQGIWVRTGHDSLLGNEKELCNLLSQKDIEKIYLPGAVTDSIFNTLRPALKSIQDIVVRHPLHLHISKDNLEYLSASHRLTCLIPFKINAIAVNSWSVTGNHLDSKIMRDTVRKQFDKLPVIDICE